MVRMPWLKMRLALALSALPGAAVGAAGCGGGQGPEPEPVTNKPVLENKIAPDEKLPEPELPALSADQWCGSADEAMARGGYRGDQEACPSYTYYEGYDWERDRQNGDMRSERTGTTVCCYERVPYQDHVYEGRPLLIDGVARTAAGAPGTTWVADEIVDPSIASGLEPALRDELARRWLHNGLLEHASVASFARAAIELMAVGAPPSLISATHRAALDEVRHARLCFAIASSFAGEPVGAGPLAAAPPRDLDLAGLAAATFVEGCVSESIGALEAERLAGTARHPAVRRVLAEIAADEARHAELAWSTVGWAVRAGGPRVLDAVVSAAQSYALPAAAAGSGESLVVHGVAGDDERAEAMRRGWTELIEPLLADLVGGGAHAGAAQV